MPAIAHLQRRILEASDGSGGISSTAIALIVILGILPCIVLIWVVCYLFWAYPNDRNCCCVKRKRRSDKDAEPQLPMVGEAVYEKSGAAMPQRPYVTNTRVESASSSGSGSGRLHKDQRPISQEDRKETRISLASVGSGNSVQVMQQPKPFV